MGSLAVGKAGASARGLAKAPKKLLHEARALLVPLAELREGSNPERTILTAAKGLNVLSQRDIGRAAMVSTSGLLEAMIAVVTIWLDEEILPKQSQYLRQQSILASQQRTGLAGRSRNSQSTWYSMELLDALCRLAKNETACQQALAKLGGHRLFLRIMAAPAAPIGVRSACATGLRSLASLGPCRQAMMIDKCVQKLIRLIESLQSKIDSLQGNFEIEYTNLQLQSLEVLTCLLDADDGREQVLYTGIRILSKILISSLQDIVKLAAAAGIALCLKENDSAHHHVCCAAGPKTLVHTADVLLNAADRSQIKPTSAGALADVVRAIQRSSQGFVETRCGCKECSISDDMKARERDTSTARDVAAMAAHLNITQRYLLVRGGLCFRSDEEDGEEEWVDPGVAGGGNELFMRRGQGEERASSTLHHVQSGGLFDAHFQNISGHRSHFFASKNGSHVVKRPVTGDGRGRRHQTRTGELLPPPWGPPPSVIQDAAGREAEVMQKLVTNSNLEKISCSMTFKSRGDRQAWQFLLGHVATGASGRDLLERKGVSLMNEASLTPDIVMSLGSLGRDQPRGDVGRRHETSTEGLEDTGKKGEIEDGQVDKSSTITQRRVEKQGSESKKRIGLMPEHPRLEQEAMKRVSVGDMLDVKPGQVSAGYHSSTCPLSPLAGFSLQEGNTNSGAAICNCGLCPPFKGEIGPQNQGLESVSSDQLADFCSEHNRAQPLTDFGQGSTGPLESCNALSKDDSKAAMTDKCNDLHDEVWRRSGAQQGIEASSPMKDNAPSAMNEQWSAISSIPAPLKPFAELSSLSGVDIEDGWNTNSPISSPPPPPAAGFPAPGQYSHSDKVLYGNEESRSMIQKDSHADVSSHSVHNKAVAEDVKKSNLVESMLTPRRAASSGLPSLSCNPSPRLIWSEAGAGAENITQGVLITTHSVRPISRDELRVRPSTGEQGARKRVFIKVRPSTGEWKSSRGSVGKSDRSHGAFEDRTFALDGWGKDLDCTSLASEDKDLIFFARRDISVKEPKLAQTRIAHSSSGFTESGHPEILRIND